MNVGTADQILAQIGDDPADYERNLERHDGLYEELVTRAAILPGSSVLELGTGTAPVAIKLAQRIGPNGRVVGIDVNEGMLKIAKEKMAKLGLSNMDFKMMSMEAMKFPDNTFDHAISNFGVCCCFYYDKTLREVHRVLRPGGKLTFNQSGPHDADVSQVFDRVFSKYKNRKPSELLKRKRQADFIQSRMTKKYRDPFAVLALLREIGFEKPEATITNFQIVFPTVQEYLNYALFANLTFSEMNTNKQEELQRKCSAALNRLVTDKGLVRNEETVYYYGYK
jgi:ubiquinone/menaquinone biosynthesis C-methylase UbiE